MRVTRARRQPDQAKEKALSQVLMGEVAIVTGASSGIGADAAWELARRGATVVLAARRVGELEAQASKNQQCGISRRGYSNRCYRRVAGKSTYGANDGYVRTGGRVGKQCRDWMAKAIGRELDR